MKKMRVTVNGKAYEVEVEVLEDDEGRYPGAAPTLTPPHASPPAAAAPRPVPQPVIPTQPDARTNQVSAPIVGTVTKILVSPGAAVKANQPLLVLDAMKMDTYINSPHDGVVEQVHCGVGESVHVGQKLVTFQ